MSINSIFLLSKTGEVKQVGFLAGSERDKGVMDEHSGESEEEEVMDEGIGESEMEELVPE